MIGELDIKVELSTVLETRAEISKQLEIKATLPQTVKIDEMKIASTDTDSVYETIHGEIDGDNRVFALPQPYGAGKLVIFYNGNQELDFTELDPEAGTFELGFAPQDDDTITALYT